MTDMKRRNRGVDFDAAKVQSKARANGLPTLTALELHYRNYYPDTPEDQQIGIIEKAWNGKHADRKPADKLARCLGLADALPLLQNHAEASAWSRLLTDPRYRTKRTSLRVVTDRPPADAYRLVRIDDTPAEDHLPRIPLDAKWHLQLGGKAGQAVFILVRSERRFFQLAPVEKQGFSNLFQSSRLRYPLQGELEFDPVEGPGWRQFIAIKAERIPIQPRTPATGYDCTAEELEIFARHLLDSGNEGLVDTSEIIVTPPSTKTTDPPTSM